MAKIGKKPGNKKMSAGKHSVKAHSKTIGKKKRGRLAAKSVKAVSARKVISTNRGRPPKAKAHKTIVAKARAKKIGRGCAIRDTNPGTM